MTPQRLFALLCLLGLAGALVVSGLQAGNTRVKRQSGQRPQNQLDSTRPSVGASAQGAAQASTSSLGSPLRTDGQSGSGGLQASVARPKKPKRPAESDFDAELAAAEDELPARVRPKKRRPVDRRPAEEDDELPEENYDCLDDYYDDGRDFHEAVLRPVRQFGRMMDGMFNSMRGLAQGDFSRLPSGGNVAVASSSSDGDGYSRTSSLVNNNGRTRGIVSETRNGRTRTRRIDDNEDED